MREDKKIIFVSARTEADYDDHKSVCEITEIKTPEDFVKNIFGRDAVISYSDIIPLLIKDPEFVNALSVEGFGKSDRVKAFGDRATLTGEFFIYDPRSTYSPLSRFEESSPYKAKDLAKDSAVFMVGVNKSCLKILSPKAHEEMLKEKDRLGVEEKKRKIRAKKSEEKKKQKEIEKAKKILEEAGL